MTDSFGARLRQRREHKQIDLIAISEQTKIKLALLEGLERDDVSAWPSGIFRRAYIRTYAQFIGLDPDVVLKDFLEAHPDEGDAFVTTAKEAAAAEEEFAKTAPGMRLRTIVDSALGSLTTKLRRPAAVDEAYHAPAPPRVTAPTGHVPVHGSHVPEEPAVDHQPALSVDELPIQSAAELTIEDDLVRAAAVDRVSQPVAAAARVNEQELARVTEPRQESGPAHEPAAAAPARVSEPRYQPADQATANAIAAQLQASHDARLENIARLCTELGCVVERSRVQQLLQETAAALSATGLIVWLWDDAVEALKPALVHGYSEKVLAHVPAVKASSDNATAAAFRTMTACEVAASSHGSGALVVPMLIPDGCAGVLALELQPGVQPARSLRAMATLLSAALTQLVHRSRPAERSSADDRVPPAVSQFRSAPSRPMKVRR
jgi:cytoskeletal protein RodZ